MNVTTIIVNLVKNSKNLVEFRKHLGACGFATTDVTYEMRQLYTKDHRLAAVNLANMVMNWRPGAIKKASIYIRADMSISFAPGEGKEFTLAELGELIDAEYWSRYWSNPDNRAAA